MLISSLLNTLSATTSGCFLIGDDILWGLDITRLACKRVGAGLRSCCLCEGGNLWSEIAGDPVLAPRIQAVTTEG